VVDVVAAVEAVHVAVGQFHGARVGSVGKCGYILRGMLCVSKMMLCDKDFSNFKDRFKEFKTKRPSLHTF
jgi:hypothetical protein